MGFRSPSSRNRSSCGQFGVTFLPSSFPSLFFLDDFITHVFMLYQVCVNDIFYFLSCLYLKCTLVPLCSGGWISLDTFPGSSENQGPFSLASGVSLRLSSSAAAGAMVTWHRLSGVLPYLAPASFLQLKGHQKHLQCLSVGVGYL